MKEAVFERNLAALALLTLGICFVVPLIAIAYFDHQSTIGSLQQAGEVTVGIGVILRATFRRIFRSAARNFFRTTLSAVSRASARNFTRRLIRFSLRMFFGMTAKSTLGATEQSGTEDTVSTRTLQTPVISIVSLAVSFIALGLSFWGVLYVVAPEAALAATTDRGLPVGLACLIAAAPILIYGLLTLTFATLLGVKIRFGAELDAMLLQAYFTGAGSFLPMTTDVSYLGSKRQKSALAMLTILAMFALHLGLLWLGRWQGSYLIEFTASMFLVYAFVYAFPIAPLEGHEIWSHNKLMWGLIFLPILLAFFFNFPEALTALL